VNGKMVPLRTRLRNGDIVEVVRAPGHKPSRDWLTFVATSRARNKIRHFIQAEEKVRSIELGRKLFEKEARRYGLNVKNLTEGERFAALLAESGFQKADELFTALAYGKLSPKAALAKLVPQEQLKEPHESALSSVVRRVLGTGEDKIKVRGMDDLMVFRARCCNPIRGEAIVGYITRGKGVSVHSATCTNVVNLLYDPDRRIDVEWDKGADPLPYTVRLSIQVEDRKGILADVSSKIAGINTNIRNVEATTTDQMGRIDMTVEISDLKHLQKVIKSLRSVDGVVDVERATR
jgi:GTP pyrophosphokinase